jgi:hypothetical protein
MRKSFLLLASLLALSACDHGNVKPVASFSPPPAPPVRNPSFNPYAPYGDANATWEPPAFNQDATIVKPSEPSSQGTRPPYEVAPWATGAQGGSQNAPPGTF